MHVEILSDSPNRARQEHVVASQSDCEDEDRKCIVDSGTSLHMMSQNELTSSEKDKQVKRTHHHHDRQRTGRVDGRSDSLRQRFGRFCEDDAVGRFTCSAISGFFLCDEIGYSYERKRKSLHR